MTAAAHQMMQRPAAHALLRTHGRCGVLSLRHTLTLLPQHNPHPASLLPQQQQLHPARHSLKASSSLHSSEPSPQQHESKSSGSNGSSSSATSAVSEPAAAAEAVDDWCQRSRLLVGADGLQKLSAVNVLLVGLGGVGSFAAEFLCRAGVGSLTLVDGDTVDTTNRNRQLPALSSTVGMLKTQVVAQRLTDINPDIRLTLHQEFLDPVRAAALVSEQPYSFVIDCIDSVAPKAALLLAGHAAGVPTISSMGAGGRLDPSRVRLADISETYNDSFAAVVRRRLRKAGVGAGITVVFSDEPAQPTSLALTEQQYKRSYFGTSSYIPGLFGLFIASHVIRSVVEPGYRIKPQPPPQQKPQQKKKQPAGGRKTSSKSSSTTSTEGSVVASSSVDSSSEAHVDEAATQHSPVPGGSGSRPATPPFKEQQQQQMFQSYEAVKGVGLGFDGEGL